MLRLGRLLSLVVLIGLGACSAGSNTHSATPSALPHVLGRTDAVTGQPGDAVSGQPADAVSGVPGDAVSGQPGDAVSGVPGDAVTGQPGDAVSGVPGAASALPGKSQNLCAAPSAPGQASCLAIENIDVPEVPNPNADPLTIKGYAPKDIRAAYRLPDGPLGKTVAIVDAYDSPTVEADLAVYRAAFGLPACTSQNGCFRKVNQSGADGSYPSADAAWGTEIALDVDMVSAACPACKILLVEAGSANLDDLGASVDKAVALGASAVSNSYYASEYAGEVQEEPHYNHIGVPITVSSGDDGIGATYPAASRYVTAVGGTIMTGNNGAYQETAGWQQTGRGCSQYISKPWWQKQFKCTGRAMTDVSALADPANGVAVYDSFSRPGHLGGWMVVGGTSVGAPLIASAYALAADFGTRNSAARLYMRYKELNDVPPVGWDYTTGLGSPNGVTAF